jgi:hypothetical protein
MTTFSHIPNQLTEQVGMAAILASYQFQILVRLLAVLTEVFHSFPQFIQTNERIVF